MKTRQKTLLSAVIAGLIAAVAYLQHSATVQDATFKAALEIAQSQLVSIQSGLNATGAVETGVELTGIVATGSTREAGEAFATCEVGEQPTEPAGDYSGNTQILNNWAHDHNCVFESINIENGTIVFTLAKPTTHDNQVHVWFKGLNAYGRLVSTKGDQTIAFPLDAVETYHQDTGKKLTLDLAKALSNDVTLQTYVATFDGNYIESIQIK